jgi:hypothetical protein
MPSSVNHRKNAWFFYDLYGSRPFEGRLPCEANKSHITYRRTKTL